jgi:hypothetical protein
MSANTAGALPTLKVNDTCFIVHGPLANVLRRSTGYVCPGHYRCSIHVAESTSQTASQVQHVQFSSSTAYVSMSKLNKVSKG